MCSRDFSVSGGRVHDVKRHCKSIKTHLLKDTGAQPSISSSLSSSSRLLLQEQVITAELYFTSFIVQHNLSFASSDHFTKLCKLMFPDSQIAKNFSCSRTKTKAIVTHALAPATDSLVSEACVRGPFSILCDEGNDKLDKKYFAIIVRYWDECVGKVVTRFLATPVCNIATGQFI